MKISSDATEKNTKSHFYKIIIKSHFYLSHVMRKPVLYGMQTTMVQISLCIHEGCSAPLLFTALIV